ncbi:Tho complex subunit 4a [Thalictrum thalictroides]|uniref:Tho complex subunit 4a n=1 Tax=Thalictrum thalictroides TaxID=46969 RepID=A0A7J6V824_THATH|nr:Tho complex subunit 4a [Thalictrum thalictroides]
MSSALDMSLEDLIKNNKKSGGGGGGSRGGRGGGGRGSSGPGPNRRFNNRGANRTTPYSLGKPVQAPDSAWQHDMFTDPVALAAAAFPGHGGRGSAIETGTKLYISNLDYGVSNEDIKFCFAKEFLGDTVLASVLRCCVGTSRSPNNRGCRKKIKETWKEWEMRKQ